MGKCVLTMLLAVGDIVGPVTGVDDVVVEEGEGTLLDGGGAVPALPVPGAGGRVREDPVLPLTVVAPDRLLTHRPLTVRTSDSVGIVTVAPQSALRACERESVGTCLQDCFSGCGVALVVVVTVLLMGKSSAVSFVAAQVLDCGRSSRCCLLTEGCIGGFRRREHED